MFLETNKKSKTFERVDPVQGYVLIGGAFLEDVRSREAYIPAVRPQCRRWSAPGLYIAYDMCA